MKRIRLATDWGQCTVIQGMEMSLKFLYESDNVWNELAKIPVRPVLEARCTLFYSADYLTIFSTALSFGPKWISTPVPKN